MEAVLGQPGPPLCVLGVFPPEADKCERNIDREFEPTTGEYSLVPRETLS